MRHRTVPKRRLAAAVVVLVLAALAACSNDDNKSSTSGTTAGTTTTTVAGELSGQVCDDAEALKSDIERLKDVDVGKNGTSSLDAALKDVGDSADALASSAGDALKPQLDDLESSLQRLRTAVGQLGSSGSASAVIDALQEVLTSARALADRVGSAHCPG